MFEITTPITPREYEGKSILCLTGAGMSVPSGIPCYWGKDGSYTKLQEKFGAPIEDVLSASNLAKDPTQVWQYMKALFDGLGDVKPNSAHHKLVELERVAKEFTLVTQNCDMLHTVAGSKDVLEIHGTARTAWCTHCNYRDDSYKEQLATVDIPACPECGKGMRPDVVLFEEFPRLNLSELEEKARTADILIVIGTQAYFGYIACMLNAFAQTGETAVWVDVERPDSLELNWMINHNFTTTLNYYPHGVCKFFEEIMPEL
ncbi:NAD-dependent protein deacetylase of SIR2 family [Vibrio chagasii]|nr:NAD-dependent protein deacetylase of SIR2 family [Vibrio chagasii]